MQVQGIPGDFLVLEYAGQGQDLPARQPDAADPEVHRRRSVEGRAGQAGRHVLAAKTKTAGQGARCSRWPPSCSGSTPRGRRTRASSFTEPDRYFRQFEADFEFDETPDQAEGHRGRARRHAEARADGPAGLRRRGLREDRGGDARGVQGRARPQAGGGAGAHHRAGAAALPHLPEALRGLPGDHRGGLRRCARRQEMREMLQRARARGKVDILIGTHKLLGGRGRRSRTWACWWSTRSSASG